MRDELKDAVVQLVELLIQGQYDSVEKITRGTRLRAPEMETAVREYGRTLVMPPKESFKLDVIQVRNRTPDTWSVRCDLWTLEEGRSDLTLELTVIDHKTGPVLEVDNIHTL